jgi:cytochrome P450
MAEVAGGTPLLGRLPVLFEEGERHHEMRRSTARYFTPTQVATYHPMIARLADDLVGRLYRRGEIDLDELSLSLAVNVAARVVGLTDSVLPGLERRVMAFVAGGATAIRTARRRGRNRAGWPTAVNRPNWRCSTSST